MITVFQLVWAHFVADFILQSDKMAVNKSHSLKWLGIHALVYSLPFIYFGWMYALVNGVMHGVVDSVTSRITSYFWKREMRHWFFVVIGLDQAIHMTCLFLSYQYLFRAFK